MIERRRIVEQWRTGNPVALATLIGVEGSSYRAAGAQLLIERDGSYVGSVSGGCLEAEIVRKAQWLVRNGACVERYSTLFDDTADIPYGLGCGGTVDVLIEPTGTPEYTALLGALAETLAGHQRRISTWAPSAVRPLRREITDENGTILFRSAGMTAATAQQSFVAHLLPPQRLFVFGAGEDARPVVRMASLLGWTVHVLDSRPQWARAVRFPEAESVHAGDTLAVASPEPQDAVVLMTHSYEQDRHWLEQVIPLRPRYLGLLGSRHRSALLVAEVAKMLEMPLDQACDRLFSPVGLDLGGDGAEAIALSVLAEIQACIQGKLGTSRRMTTEGVLQQIEKGGASRYLHAQCAL